MQLVSGTLYIYSYPTNGVSCMHRNCIAFTFLFNKFNSYLFFNVE